MADASRRQFLERSLGTLAAASLAGLPANRAGARGRDAAPSRVLAPGLRTLPGPDCNVVALAADGELLLVDGGAAQQASAVLKRALEECGARHARILINTHWHPEQTGLNRQLGKSGASLIAHENTKLWLSRPIRTSWLDGVFGPLPPSARPTITTYRQGVLEFGSETVEYGYLLQAHTDGDLYVQFHHANVIAAGGVVSGAGWPLLDWETGGWIGGLVAGYDRLLKISDESTQIVPANGPVLARRDLAAHRAMYFTIYERLVACLDKGLSPEETIAAAPAQEYAATWGDPDHFIASAFRSLWGHFAADA